jgi:5-methylcytosine-specific restriction endonuclease McrA
VTAPANITKVDRIRLRDGPRCWLCDELLDFKAAPNSSKAPTFEHLLAQCHGGPDGIENLVLCHPGCNKTLGNRPVAEKVRLREKRRRKQWRAAIAEKLRQVLGA